MRRAKHPLVPNREMPPHQLSMMGTRPAVAYGVSWIIEKKGEEGETEGDYGGWSRTK